MDTVSFVRADERMESSELEPLEVAPAPLLGSWINTNAATPGIAKVVVTDRAGGVSLRVFSANGPTPRDWGDADVEVLYSAGVHSSPAMAFVARYDFDNLEARLEANLSLGLLVIASFNTFKDGSGRSDYFGREFFYRAE